MRFVSFAIAVLTTLAAASTASAHADAPLALKVFPFDDQSWVLRTNFGVVTSAAPNRFVCEEAFLAGDRFMIAPLGIDTWVTFGQTTIHRTEDGCDFEKVQTLDARVDDVDALPPDRVAYIANGEAAGIFFSDDAGKSFAPVGDVDTSTLQLTTARFYDDTTIVVGSYEREADGAARLLAIDLASGTTTELPIPDGFTFPYVLAAGSGRIVWNARAEEQTIFVGSLDEPALHRRVQQAEETWPSGAAISTDGETIHLVGLLAGQGILSAEWSDTALQWVTTMPDTQTTCAAETDARLLVCSTSANEGDPGDLIALDAMDPTVLVRFSDFQGPRVCPEGTDVATVCPLVWPEVAPALGVDVEPSGDDAGGQNDAGDEDPVPPIDDDSSCATAAGSAPAPLLILLALFMAVRSYRSNREEHR